MTDPTITHILIVRAGGPNPDSSCIQVKVSFRGEPSDEDRHDIFQAVRAAYEVFEEEEPARAGLAVLPYYESEDGETIPAPAPADLSEDDEGAFEDEPPVLL